MKKTFILTLVFGFVLSVNSAFAESADVAVPIISVPSSVTPVTERSEVVVTKSLARIKAHGAQLIKERINALNQNAKEVAKAKSLTVEQKMAFAAFFGGKMTDLDMLGTKIAHETDASSTKVLVESIFTDYRIMGVVIPQIRLQKRIYEVQNHLTKLPDTFTKIQVKIDEQKAKGKDVSSWQKGLDDAKLLIATDTERLSVLMTQVNSMKPADYGTSSKSTIEAVNKEVKRIAKDANSIVSKVRKPSYFKPAKQEIKNKVVSPVNVAPTTTPTTSTTTQ